MLKRSKFTVALAMALLCCLLLPAMASAATVSMAYSGGSIYLRTGPGRDYGTNGVVHDGDYVRVLSYGSVWSRVETAGGRVGYIKNLYINDGDASYAAGTSYFDSYTTYTTASVNLRAGASTSTSVITTLSKGTKLTALGRNGSFYLVQTRGGTQGYVSGSYLSRSGGGSSSGSGSSSSGKTMTVTASSVNVRAGGGMHYKVLRVLPRGTVVTVLKVGNYWNRIQYGSTIGWIKKTYLK